MPLHITLLLLSVLLTGCASQQVQQQMLEQQAAQTFTIEGQKALLSSQQQTLGLLLAQQNQLQEVLELNQLQLQKLLSANKPKAKKTVKTKSAVVNQPVATVTPEVPAPQKMTLGRVESVWVERLQRYLKARLDTGAKSSSIHADDIQYFERDGKQWVRFNMYTHKRITPPAGAVAKSLIFEAPVIRTVKIKQASASELDMRPVISLRVRIGDYEDDAEFTLTTRKSMLYPVLIGRSFLQDVAVVDVGQAFIHKRRKD